MEISHSSSFFLLLLFAYSIVGNKNTWSVANGFSAFLGISLLFEIGSIITAAYGINNFWILKFFLFFELVYFNYYHRNILNSSIYIKLVNIILMIFTVGIVLLGFVFNYIDSWFLTIFILYFIAQNCFVLIALFKEKSETLLSQNEFWVAIGRLSYYMLILFIFFGVRIFDNLWQESVFMGTFVITNIAANFIRYSAYLKSFLVYE